MANITRFDPFGDLTRLDPFHGFEDVFRLPRGLMRGLPEEPQIKMDVSEDDGSYRVKAEIPGVDKNDIKVSIDFWWKNCAPTDFKLTSIRTETSTWKTNYRCLLAMTAG